MGAKYVYWAPFATDDSATAAPTYGEAMQLSELTTATFTPTMATGAQYGDNRKVEEISMFTGGTLVLEVTDLPAAARSALFGNTDVTGTGTAASSKQGGDDNPPAGGIVMIKEGIRNSVSYFEGYFFPKVKATPGADAIASRNASITPTGDALNLSVMALANAGAVYREISPRQTTEAEAIAWCNAKLGITAA